MGSLEVQSWGLLPSNSRFSTVLGHHPSTFVHPHLSGWHKWWTRSNKERFGGEVMELCARWKMFIFGEDQLRESERGAFLTSSFCLPWKQVVSTLLVVFFFYNSSRKSSSLRMLMRNVWGVFPLEAECIWKWIKTHRIDRYCENLRTNLRVARAQTKPLTYWTFHVRIDFCVL